MLARSSADGLGRMVPLLVAIHALSFTAWASYGGGSGTAADPYQIFTAGQLNEIGAQPQDLDKHFKLMADLDLSGYRGSDFHRIGTPDDGPFTGTFDGNYKTLSNFQWSSEWSRYVGLFGFVDGGQAQIMNLTLVDVNVVTEIGQYVGALAGLLRDGTIMNCHIRRGTIWGDNSVGALVGKKEGGVVTGCTACATVRGASRVGGLVGFSYWGLIERCDAAGEVIVGSLESECWAAGGLIGQNEEGVVTDCHVAGTVTGVRDVGGVIGLNLSADIRRCWANGVVWGDENVGGLIGQNDGGIISDCYSLADAAGGAFVGGLIGYHAPSCTCTVGVPGLIERCYAAGPVAGTSDVGGLVGVNIKSHITDSFWDIEASGCKSSGGGTAMTTKQMQTLSTYTDAGWDFSAEKQNRTEDIWYLPAPGNYPRLTWQAVMGDLNGDGNVDFRDLSVLARQWRQIDNGFWSRGAFLAADGVIDLDDLDVLAHAWLTGGR
jgi:hypothetical protein